MRYHGSRELFPEPCCRPPALGSAPQRTGHVAAAAVRVSASHQPGLEAAINTSDLQVDGTLGGRGYSAPHRRWRTNVSSTAPSPSKLKAQSPSVIRCAAISAAQGSFSGASLSVADAEIEGEGLNSAGCR